jgi:hypothetical protein
MEAAAFPPCSETAFALNRRESIPESVVRSSPRARVEGSPRVPGSAGAPLLPARSSRRHMEVCHDRSSRTNTRVLTVTGEVERSPVLALAAIAEEIATFRNRLPQLLREQAGRFVLIKSADILGTFPDRSAALREGYSRFGVVVPFLVKQIADPEPVVYLPNVVPGSHAAPGNAHWRGWADYRLNLKAASQ